MKGAGCQRTTAAPAQGEVFSLDIPFYRTPALGRMKGAGCQRTTAAPAQGEVFSLDIPFYRTPALGRMKGAGCQRTTAAPAQGEVFSLDIPFYRTRDSVIGHLRSVFSIAVRSDAYFCPAVMLRVLEQSRRTG